MLWVFLAISAHLVWALVNLLDRYVMEKRLKEPFFYTVVILIFDGLASLLFLPFIAFHWIGWTAVVGALFAGIVFILGTIFFSRAIQIEEASRVNILWVFIPIFDFIFGWLLLGEKLAGKQLLAFIILLSGSLIACLHWRGGKWKFSRAFILMLISCLFYSGYDIIIRYFTRSAPFSLLYFIASFSMLFWLVPILSTKKFRQKYQSEFKYFNLSLAVIAVFVSFFSGLGLFLNTRAISLGPVSLVSALEGFQMIFVFVIAALLTIFVPQIMKEEFDRKNLVLKLMALVLMLGGIAVLYL
ncbi:MAG: DMT family transporter [Candidatus Magasanikbacteria bacterium]|nr:DMT family transporter [Candidatus Magasanikbacteria bacterium]